MLSSGNGAVRAGWKFPQKLAQRGGGTKNARCRSAITIQSLADLGYTVDAGLADAYRLPDAAAAASIRENAIGLGNDILRNPIVVVDRNGRIVRVIPP